MRFEEILDISTPEQLLAFAQYLENQAADNYEKLALEMRSHANIQTAELFERLAEEERSHEKAIIRLKDKQQQDPCIVLWDFPIEMIMDGQAGDPYLLTPYAAICYALYNEEKAFELFTHLAAMAKDDVLRLAAERFAQEEISHMVALRLARLNENKNLRQTRDELGWWVDIENIQNARDLKLVLTKMESTTAHIYQQASEHLQVMQDTDNAHFFAMLAARARESALSFNIENVTTGTLTLRTEETPAKTLLAALKYTDQTLDYVTFIAEKAVDNDIYAATSEISERFARRLGSIRERLSMLFAN